MVTICYDRRTAPTLTKSSTLPGFSLVLQFSLFNCSSESAIPDISGFHHLVRRRGNQAGHTATQRALLSLPPIGPWPWTKSTPRVQTYIKNCEPDHVENKNKMTVRLQTDICKKWAQRTSQTLRHLWIICGREGDKKVLLDYLPVLRLLL